MKFKLPSKKYMLYSVIVTGIIITILTQVINITLTNKLKKQIDARPAFVIQSASESVDQEFDIAIQDRAMYRLCECGGKIGIYDAESEILIDIIDVFVSSLPRGDRQALKQGIDVFTFSELAKLIDDFST